MNRFFTLLLATSCLTAVGQVPDYVPTDGLVAWYPLDGNAVDLSGSNADGILNGPEAALDRFNVESSALAFDGLDDWVGLGDLNPISEGTSGHASFSFWINVESLNASNLQAVLIGDEIYQNNGVLYQLANDYGFGAYVAGSSNWDGYCGCFPILNEWQHVVFVQGENGTDLYLDGQHLVNLLADVFNNETTSPYRIGGFAPVFSSRFFDGRMDDLGIWSRALSVEEIQEVYLATPPFMGCTDESACNFDLEAVLDDGSCHFNCQFCLTGTVWSEELGGCIGDGSGDINLDGCVQLNDLLDLLSAYGDCGVEETPWQCGDPLSYQGYDYTTVQIGEQCWFAENLRAENYRNGDVIPVVADDATWNESTMGTKRPFENDLSNVSSMGYLYSWYAGNDDRELCPTGWHVPSKTELAQIEMALGMPESEALSEGWYGSDLNVSERMRSTSWGGSDELGFNVIRAPWESGDINATQFLTSTLWDSNNGLNSTTQCWTLVVTSYQQSNYHADSALPGIYSVRCLKDSE